MKFAQSFPASLSLVLCSTLFGDVCGCLGSLVSILWGILWIDLNCLISFVCQINLTQRPLTFIISVHLHGIAWVMHSSSFGGHAYFFQQLIGVRCAGRPYIFVSNEQVLTYTAHDNIFNSAAWFHQNSNRPVPDAFQFLTISRICFEHVWIGLTLCDGLLQADTSCLIRPWKKKWQWSHRSMVATDDPCLTLVGVTSFWLLLYSTYPMLLITFAFDQSWILWVSCCLLCFSELCSCSLLARYS